MIDSPGESRRWDFELLKIGRHFRYDTHTKVILGRDAAENDQLRYAHQLPDAASTAVFAPENFAGPQALLIGPRTDAAIAFAASLMLRYSRDYDPDNALVRVDDQIINAIENDRAKSLETIAMM